MVSRSTWLSMTLPRQQAAEIRGMMDCYREMYRTKNTIGLLSLFSPRICGYGSGPDEVVRDLAGMKAQVKRDLSQADSVRITFENVHVAGEMPVAWVMADCEFEVVVKGTRLAMAGRFTAVLKNTGSRWLFEMIHFSVPALTQAPGESYPGSA